MTEWHDHIVELRPYHVHPELRHQLVAVFDQYFVDGQEADGMHIIGQFVDLDRPDRFVWLRGFDTMEQRLQSLTAFYSGPVWKAHSHEANPTMIDVDDVLLLHPAGLWQPSAAPSDTDPRIIDIALCPLIEPADPDQLRVLRNALEPVAEGLIGVLVTHHAANTFPALPVRDGDEHLVIVHARPPEPTDAPSAWSPLAAIVNAAALPMRGPITQRRLLPTPNSQLR
jgi:hypothetical protein